MNKIDKYIEGLKGPRLYIARFPLETKMRDLMQKVRISIKTNLGKDHKVSYLWVKTTSGVILTISGNRLVTDFVVARYLKDAEILSSSRSHKHVSLILEELLVDRLTRGAGNFRGSYV